MVKPKFEIGEAIYILELHADLGLQPDVLVVNRQVVSSIHISDKGIEYNFKNKEIPTVPETNVYGAKEIGIAVQRRLSVIIDRGESEAQDQSLPLDIFQ